MNRRLLGLGIAMLLGGIGIVLWLRRSPRVSPAPDIARDTPKPPTPDEDVAAEIEAAIETPPVVRPLDLAEVAFLAAAIAPDPALAAPDAPEPAEAEPAEQPETVRIEAYCMRCRTKRPIANARIEQTAEGRWVARGTCQVCGSNVVRFVKQPPSDRAEKE